MVLIALILSKFAANIFDFDLHRLNLLANLVSFVLIPVQKHVSIYDLIERKIFILFDHFLHFAIKLNALQ